jgi:hypothetical protein
MQRLIFVTSFALTILGLVALGVGSTGSASDTAGPSHPGTNWIAIPTNGPDSSFGKLMPDGSYCGAACADEP